MRPRASVLVLFGLVDVLTAQGSWRRIDATLPRGEYDPDSGAIVGGHLDEIRAFDGAETRWIATLPANETVFACVRDRVRGGSLVVTRDPNRVVRSRVVRDGQIAPPIAQSLASWGGYAWDPVGARILFVPNSGSPSLAAWNGVQWTPVPSATRPPPRDAFALATDPVRNRIVLFGGMGWQGSFDDTWEWDGNDWTSIATTNRPPARAAAGMAFDERIGRMVLLGGVDGFVIRSDTWHYDGVDWRLVSTTGGPDGASAPTLAFFPPADVMLAAGAAESGDAAIWTHDAATWTQKEPRSIPFPSFGSGAATDRWRNRVVVHAARAPFGNGTWEWDGWRWHRAARLPSQPARDFAPLAFDDARGRTVLFGGGWQRAPGNWQYFDETWEYDGTAWSYVTSTGPSGRLGHAMEFLPTLQEIVLFGGRNLGGILGDTWTFDGVTWTDRTQTLAVAPTARAGHGLAIDPIAAHLVLFGGNAGGFVGDTWTFDGTWVLRASAGPGARSGALLETDLAAGRVIMSGGSDALGPFVDTWSWNGAIWVREATHASPGPSAVAAIDPISGRVVAMADIRPMAVFTPAPATAVAIGQGCSGTAGVPVLRAVGAPRLGESGFAVRIDQARGGALAATAIDAVQAVTQLGNGCVLGLRTPTPIGFVFAKAAGHASFALPVPATPALRGFSVYLQGAVLDPQGALAGQLAITPGLWLRIGD